MSTSNRKMLLVAAAIPGIGNPVEIASMLARLIRAEDRSINRNLVQFALVDGSDGTIDFLVTNSLGSFLEVETRGSDGKNVIAPLGLAGEDGKLAIIEMSHVARVSQIGISGTTTGIGELIQDALDEGAFSIVLAHQEPLACDAGFGAAQALGVRFFDHDNREIDFTMPDAKLSRVERIDCSARSFSLLSSRIFIARARSVQTQKQSFSPSELERIAEIIRRDTGITVPTTDMSVSGIELGLVGLLGAVVRDGMDLVLEASGIMEAIQRDEFTDCIILAPSYPIEETSVHSILEKIRSQIPRRSIITVEEKSKESHRFGESFSLKDVNLFQVPLNESSNSEDRRRDFLMRLEKTIPDALKALHSKASNTSQKKFHA